MVTFSSVFRFENNINYKYFQLFLILYFYIYYTRALIFGIIGYLLVFLPIPLLLITAMIPLTSLFYKQNSNLTGIGLTILTILWFLMSFLDLSIGFIVLVILANSIVLYLLRTVLNTLKIRTLKDSSIIVASIIIFDTVMKSINSGKDNFIGISFYSWVIYLLVSSILLIVYFSNKQFLQHSPQNMEKTSNYDILCIGSSVISFIIGMAIYILYFGNHGLLQISLSLNWQNALLIHLWLIFLISFLVLLTTSYLDFIDISISFVLVSVFLLSLSFYPWMDYLTFLFIIGLFVIVLLLSQILVISSQAEEKDHRWISAMIIVGYVINIFLIQQTVLSDNNIFRIGIGSIFSILAYFSIFRGYGDE